MSDLPRVLKVYDVIRTAHLERTHESARTTILYREHRYDFDTALAAARDVRRAGVWRTWLWTLRNDVGIIEVSEPLMVRSAPRSLAAIHGNRMRARLRGQRPARVVAYAIENKDPRETVRAYPVRTRIRWRGRAALVPLVWRRTDRVAFGTRASMELYERWFAPSSTPSRRLVEALPAARRDAETGPRPRRLLFVGDLSVRKGFQLLADAWPAVRAALEDATLEVMGKGALEPVARALADGDARVTLTVDPSRDAIFEAMGEAKVLALPSQPTPIWREQVGLPIVEALSMGCFVVTTTETGLAAWLHEHGHGVVPPHDAAALTHALVDGLQQRVEASQLLAALPETDGRAEAELWLHAGVEASER